MVTLETLGSILPKQYQEKITKYLTANTPIGSIINKVLNGYFPKELRSICICQTRMIARYQEKQLGHPGFC
jgi:hypothetical protein